MPESRGAWTPARVAIAVVGFGAGFSALPSAARAGEPSAEPIAIAYTAEETCPREGAFIASTRRYTSRWTPVASGDGLRSFRVRLERHGAGHTGTLVITMPDGARSIREIAGPDCVSVARGLAVVVALAIDPQAHVGAPDPDTEPEVPPPERASEPSELPAATGPAPPPPPPRPSVARPKRSAATARSRPHLTFGVEGRVELTSAVLTGAVPVAGAALEVRANLGEAMPSWFSPSLAGGIRQSLPVRIDVGPGVSEFLWTAGTLRFCPVRFAAPALRFEAAPCAELDVGLLRAEARGLADARTTSNRWFDRGASVRTAFRLSPSWGIGAAVLVTAPVTRDRFAVASGELISKAPAVGVTAGLLLELRL